MAGLSADQRNDYYLTEATRTGIHKPILAALYAVHRRPSLGDGELGLGISPANRIPLEQVNTFAGQVQFAANTVRSLINQLIAQGWTGQELWNAEQGCYSERLIEILGSGYSPSTSDQFAARLEPSDDQQLLEAYRHDWMLDSKAAELPTNLEFVDAALLQFIEPLPRFYLGLSYQRLALLEAARLWRRLDSRPATIAALLHTSETDPALSQMDSAQLDPLLLQWLQQSMPDYAGYPHQREALLRLTQLWQQLDSREVAIARLATHASAEVSIQVVDPALVAFVQRVPQTYQGKGDQRNTLTETYRLWYGLESRGAALKQLGVDPQVLTASNPNRTALMNTAAQLDRSLLEFVKRLPALYQETEIQREALLQLVQHWRNIDGREKTLQTLVDDVQRMETARRDSLDAAPAPEPIALPPRPPRWTCDTLQLHAAILTNGNFTWAEATHGGKYLPPNQAVVDAIVRMAELTQQARDRIGRPLRILTWYRPAEADPQRSGTVRNRHALGDAIEFYCDGLTGSQLYRALDPWWIGGLGRYRAYPELCYLDARPDPARWTR
ncbi:MAG: peptidase M15A [Synechococcales cyanobacterium M58_A2018_015]|nr:peptidase M15A [Synechococcales cyanobacterium M58_A2018_015]